MRALLTSLAVLAGLAAGACSSPSSTPSTDVDAFLADVNEAMLRLGTETERTNWVYSTYITVDTERLSARANQVYLDAVARYAKEAARFDGVEVTGEQRRQLDILKLALELVTPSDPALGEELTNLASGMEAAYGRGQWCPEPGPPEACVDIEAITEIIATSRDEARLRAAWEGWRTISVPMRSDYERFVELANVGARELGFADTGAMWRLKYDMPADEFTRELDRLWEQVRPLYVSLHAYVRMKLGQRYGDAVPADGPIPAHLLGNIWAQDWSNVSDLVASGSADPGYSLTNILRRRGTSATEMVRIGERFYSSLGLAPMPETFWERSLFVKPEDRAVVCHASAWNIDQVDALRIKLCIDPRVEVVTTIHPERGHD
jgi:peptidyl-dipeptidase A